GNTGSKFCTYTCKCANQDLIHVKCDHGCNGDIAKTLYVTDACGVTTAITWHKDIPTDFPEFAAAIGGSPTDCIDTNLGIAGWVTESDVVTGACTLRYVIMCRLTGSTISTDPDCGCACAWVQVVLVPDGMGGYTCLDVYPMLSKSCGSFLLIGSTLYNITLG